MARAITVGIQSCFGDVESFPSLLDDDDDIDNDVTFEEAVQVLLTASELVARATSIIERKWFTLI